MSGNWSAGPLGAAAIAIVVVLGCAGERVSGPSNPPPSGGRAAIGPAGGAVSATLEGGATLTITIPAGALVESVTVSLDPVSRTPGALTEFGLTPAGLRLAHPATIRVVLPRALAPDARTRLAFRQDGRLVPVPTVIDPVARTATASLPLLGLPATADTAGALPTAGLRSVRAAAGAGVVVNLELDSLLQLAQATLVRLQALGTVEAGDAMHMAMTSLLEFDLPLVRADPRFGPLVAAWRTAACNEYSFRINAVEGFAFASDYRGLVRVFAGVVGWGRGVAEMTEALGKLGEGGCAPALPLVDTVVARRVNQLLPTIRSDLNAFVLTPSPRDSVFLIDRIRPLLTLAADLSVADHLDPAIAVTAVVEGQLVRLRAAAYRECRVGRDQRIQSRMLLGEVAGGVFGGATPYDVLALERDVALCGMDIAWALRDTTGTAVRSGRLGGGDSMGTVNPDSATTFPGRGELVLAGNLNALICPPPASANNERLIVKAGAPGGTLVALATLTPSNDNRYLAASPLVLTTDQLRTAAGLSPGSDGVVRVGLERSGETCSGRFPRLAHTSLGHVDVTLSDLAITTTALPDAEVGSPYSVQLRATQTTGLVWSIATGALPQGITLDPATGVLAGQPASAGDFGFTVLASNGPASDQRALTLHVAAGPLSLAGRWTGTFTVALATGGTASLPIVVDLTQTGTALAGSYDVGDGVHAGSVSGSLAGLTLTGSMTQQAPCAGTFAGSGTVNAAGTAITAQFNGSDCHNTHSGGQLLLSR